MAANTCNQPPFRGNGTGAQADYVFGFEYINRADVEVYVGEPGDWTQFTEGNAANANEYQWQNATTIRLNAATGTDNVLITRETDRCDPAVEFFAGTSIRAEDLNANQEQTLFLIQELAETMSENGMDQPPGSDGITLDDLEDVNITTTNERRWLRWDNTAEEWQDQPILQDGDAWVADDNHVVTSEAGDDRWLRTDGGGGSLAAGAGITFTTADGTTTIAADLEANGAGAGGLAFDPAGATGQIRVDVHDGLELTADGVAVDLADTSGLEFNSGDLRIDVNSGCEIVADGLNAETTAASIVQTGDPASNADPAIRISTTLGDTTTNTDLVINGGANTTVTRDDNGQLTIASSGGTGLTYRGTVNPTTTGTTSALVDGDVNDVFAVDTTGTLDTDPDWQTAINGDATTVTAGDLLQCVTAGDGTAANTRFTLIETGTPAAGVPTLQQVTGAGNTSSNNIILQTGDPAVINTRLNANGSAVFNEAGASVDFRIESDTSTHMLFVDGDQNRVGINNEDPGAPLDVEGDIRISNNANNTISRILLDGSAVFNEQGAEVDFRVESDDNENMLFIDGSEDRVGIGTNAPTAALDARGGAVFNEDGSDVDFRVESDDNENMLFVDASTDRVGIGINAPLGTLHIVGPNEAASGQLRIVSNADDQNARATWYRNGTFVGSLQANADTLFFQLEDNMDWRVTTDNIQNMLFVDGTEDRVGINTGTPRSFLDVNGQVTIDQNAIAAGAGNWNLANGNFWTLGAVVIPNPTNMVAGMSGLIVNTAAATWPAAGGATFQYAANTPPNITEFPAVIPFYCTNNTTIFIGTPTVNIV